MGAEATEKPLHPPVQVWMRGQQVSEPGPAPAPSAFPQPAHLVPAARQAAGRAPAPQWPRPGREAGGEAAGPAGRIFPQRPGHRRGRHHGDRGGQPSPRQRAAQRSKERSLQPQTPDLGGRRTGHGRNQKPTGKWGEGSRKGVFSSHFGTARAGSQQPAASPGPERRRASSARDCGSTSSGCEQPLPPSGSAPDRLPAASATLRRRAPPRRQ